MARKPRFLSRLKISEVSLVDHGAGEGVKVMLAKRRAPMSDNARRYYETFKTVDFAKAMISQPSSSPLSMSSSGTRDEGDDDSKLSPALEQHINALIVAVPSVTREQAANFLLHTSHGRELLRTLATVKSTTKSEKEFVMDRATELQSIVKSHGGIQAMAKLFVAANKSIGDVTEHEFTKLMHDEAQKTRLPNERPDQAFARFYSAPESLELRKAIQICKSVPSSAPLMAFEPTQTSDALATVTADDSAAAYAQLTEMAEAMRAKSPDLTIAQCFARIFTDSANAELAAKAHRRPVAGDAGYAYPTA